MLPGALPIGVEEEIRSANATTRRRTIVRDPNTNGQLCRHTAERPADEQRHGWGWYGMARRGYRQSSSIRKRSKLGTGHRGCSGAQPLRRLASLVISRGGRRTLPGKSNKCRIAVLGARSSSLHFPTDRARQNASSFPHPLPPDLADTHFVSFRAGNLHFQLQICDDNKMCLRAL